MLGGIGGFGYYMYARREGGPAALPSVLSSEEFTNLSLKKIEKYNHNAST
jgi:hypothetical protein